jgi:hypothetical protein
MTTHDEPPTLEPWRRTFRVGFAPLLSTEALRALEKALVGDDPALIQSATTDPPPLSHFDDFPPTAACAIGYGAWKGDGLATVGEVEKFFYLACCEADCAVGESSGSRYFLNWFDETPRDNMRAALLPEIRRAIGLRDEDAPLIVRGGPGASQSGGSPCG